MEENLKIDRDYKKAFNLGYELAKELDLKSPMFKNHKPEKTTSNAMQAGTLQYIEELELSKNKNISQSTEMQKAKAKSKNSGKGLTP